MPRRHPVPNQVTDPAEVTSLARHNEIEFDRGGVHFRLKVPDEVRVKVELEVDDDGTELEIELAW